MTDSNVERLILYHGIRENTVLVNNFLKQRWRVPLTMAVSNQADLDSLRCPNTIHDLVPVDAPLPYADSTFDIVGCDTLLAFLPQVSRIRKLNELTRVLRPEGRLILTIPYPLGISGIGITNLLTTHRYFTDKGTPFYCVNISETLATLNANLPYNCQLFPGFSGFDENSIESDRSILTNKWLDHPNLPDIPTLRRISVIYIGIALFATP